VVWAFVFVIHVWPGEPGPRRYVEEHPEFQSKQECMERVQEREASLFGPEYAAAGIVVEPGVCKWVVAR